MFFVLQCGSENSPAFFDNEKQSFKHGKKNKKKALCYGILVLWYIDAIIFKKKNKVIRVFQTKNIWIHLRKNHFYGCPAFYIIFITMTLE